MSDIAKYAAGAVILVTVFQFCGRYKNSGQIKGDTLKSAKAPILKKNNTSFDTLSVTQGDLNFDNIADFVVVLKHNGEDTTSTAPRRPLQIFFKNKDGSSSLFCTSENTVMTHDMGGTGADGPFAGIEIKKGKLEISHYGGMGSYYWQQTISFKFSKKENAFYLERVQKEEMKESENRDKTTVKTPKDFGVIPFSKYDIFENEELCNYN